jgi:hypothetical protein
MIPFDRTWPYDIIRGDVYVSDCPFCDASNVLVPLKPSEMPDIRDGKKKLLVFPCCHGRVTVLNVDGDYLLTDQKLR